MNLPILNWFTRADGFPLLMQDLRLGRAGLALRLTLSLAAAGLVTSMAMAVLGVIHVSGTRITDGHAFVAFSLAGVLWCGALAWLWSGFRRWQRTMRTSFGIIALWALLTPVCAVIDAASYRADFLIVAVVIFGIAVTLAVIATAAYSSRGGKPVLDDAGGVQVKCPQCGYSMIGLDTCQCPECGHRCTIDALIATQDYATLRLPTTSGDDSRQLPTAEPSTAVRALPHGAS